MPSTHPLQPNILATLVLFSQSDFPLTLQEIQSWLIATPEHPLPTSKPSLSELETILRTDPLVSSYRGFYFLRGTEMPAVKAERMLSERLKRYDIAEHKWQTVMPKIKTISTLPFVRAVFVVNTLSWSNARADSDIDLCIITKPGYIWTARQWVTGWAALKQDRPTAEHEADTLCLSLYLTTDHLNFQPVTINPQDIHLAMWLEQFHPVYDPEHLHQKLWAANPWARELLPYAEPQLPEYRRRLPTSTARHTAQRLLEAAQPLALNRLYKKWQLKIMPPHLKALNNTPGVVISDSMLKFHDKDPRQTLHQAWLTQLTSLPTP